MNASAGSVRPVVSRRARLRAAVLVPLFLMIYTEWGEGGSFLFQLPIGMLRDGRGADAWLHLLVAGPCLSMCLLLAAAWWRRVPRFALIAAVLLPTLVALLILLGSIFGARWTSLLSLLPYATVLVLLLRSLQRPSR